MRILFMGTPEFAVPSLEAVQSKHDIIGVFTKVDKPNLRGKKIRFSQVKEFALKNNIPVYQPNSVRDAETLNIVRDLNPDLIIVVAYGKILPKELIDIPKYGVINVHSSLLPKYRGAAPIHAAIINGESETGVSIMYIAEELDAGDIILQSKTPIYEEDNLETLHDRLAELGSEALIEAVDLIETGEAPRIAQEHEKATFVKPIQKDECIIDWSKSRKEVYNFIRGLNPFPSSHTYLDGKIFKIYDIDKIEKEYQGECGEIVDIVKNAGPVVKVQDGGILIKSAKPENKRKISGADLINGNLVKSGDKFRGKQI